MCFSECNIQTLDVSKNKFGMLGIELLLKTINPATLLSLDMGSTLISIPQSYFLLHIQHFLSQVLFWRQFKKKIVNVKLIISYDVTMLFSVMTSTLHLWLFCEIDARLAYLLILPLWKVDSVFFGQSPSLKKSHKWKTQVSLSFTFLPQKSPS